MKAAQMTRHSEAIAAAIRDLGPDALDFLSEQTRERIGQMPETIATKAARLEPEMPWAGEREIQALYAENINDPDEVTPAEAIAARAEDADQSPAAAA